LWDLAEAYGRPVAYFFAETPDVPEHQDFRLWAVRQREPLHADLRKLVVAEFEELCRSQSALEAVLERRQEPLIELIRAQAREINQPERLARLVRERWDLKSGPISDLRGLLDRSGVKVFVVGVPGEGLSGTSWWHAVYGPAMLVNRLDIEQRRVFTMAHELAHLLRRGAHVFCGYLNLEVAEEAFANRFAASLLMPEDDVRRFVEPLRESEELGGWDTPDAALDKVARRYKTSREAVAWRLEYLRLLPQGFTQQKRRQWSMRRPARGRKGERWRRHVQHLGGTYTSMVKQAYDEGLISLSAVADMLRIDVAHADEWLRTREDR
jgi:Zn-dependent peptidase ImmA (M78 family)